MAFLIFLCLLTLHFLSYLLKIDYVCKANRDINQHDTTPALDEQAIHWERHRKYCRDDSNSKHRNTEAESPLIITGNVTEKLALTLVNSLVKYIQWVDQ